VDRAVPEGEAVVLDVPQLQTMLRKSFNLGVEVDRRGPRALVRLQLAKALVGAAEANATAVKGIAIEHQVSTEAIAGSEADALHAAAASGMPDPLFHLCERTIGIITGLAALEPDPGAGESDLLLDTALRAATGLQLLLQFRHDVTTASTQAEHEAATERLIAAGEQLRKAADPPGAKRRAKRTVPVLCGRLPKEQPVLALVSPWTAGPGRCNESPSASPARPAQAQLTANARAAVPK
jgi:hypothetical protein